MIKKYVTTLKLGITASLLTTGFSLAEDTTSLSQKVNDPTASLMSVQIVEGYTIDHYNGFEGESANNVMLRAAYPYEWGETKHILRVSQPFITNSPSDVTSVQDMTIFDLAVFSASWGRYGLGVVAAIPFNKENKQWSLGPSFGFVNNTITKGLNVGLFNQNLFRVVGDDNRPYTRVSSLQPIVNYSLGGGWNVGMGDIQYTYDWESTQWISLPVAIQLGKLVRFKKLPVNFSLQYQHDFADEVSVGNGLYAPTPKDVITFTVKFVLPKF